MNELKSMLVSEVKMKCILLSICTTQKVMNVPEIEWSIWER